MPDALPMIPELLTFQDGTPVRTPEEWERRRTELRQLYARHMYGPIPAADGETLHWQLQCGALVITVAANGRQTSFTVPVLLPDGAAPAGGWPCLIECSWAGVSDIARQAAARGYAALAYTPYDAAADNDSYTGAFYTLYPHVEAAEPTGVLAAWAWGAMKILDALYAGAGQALGINPALNLVAGVSRFGKSAAVAGAFDDRFRVVIPACSGAGGVAMMRFLAEGRSYDLRSLGYDEPWVNGVCEKLQHLQSPKERHWFCPDFLRFATPEELPFDQHMLAALCAAPGRHFISVSGVLSEPWSSVESQVMAWLAALPAWQLLGIGDNSSMLIHLTGHCITPEDLTLILDYCDQAFFGIAPAHDLSVMKTNVFMEEANASPLLRTFLPR